MAGATMAEFIGIGDMEMEGQDVQVGEHRSGDASKHEAA
jgi:hypothetical protein